MERFLHIAGLEQEGIQASLPTGDYTNDTPFYAAEQFSYDEKRDLYLCPQGQQLTRWTNKTEAQAVPYRAEAKVCNACPVKAQCTDSISGKAILRSWFQEEIDRVKAYWQTPAHTKAMRKRQVWVGPLEASAKHWHYLRGFRLCRLQKVNIEALLTATGQNFRRFLNHRRRRYRPGSEGTGNKIMAPKLPTLDEELVAS